MLTDTTSITSFTPITQHRTKSTPDISKTSNETLGTTDVDEEKKKIKKEKKLLKSVQDAKVEQKKVSSLSTLDAFKFWFSLANKEQAKQEIEEKQKEDRILFFYFVCLHDP